LGARLRPQGEETRARWRDGRRRGRGGHARAQLLITDACREACCACVSSGL
jgi:hypothetical protein